MKSMKNKSKIIIFAALVGAVLAVVLVVAAAKRGDSGGRDFSGQLEMAAGYLEAMEYEQALAIYREILDIEPRNADAYLGIVEVYIRTGEYETALEYAREGYNATGDERLAQKVGMLENGNITRWDGQLVRQTAYDEGGGILYRYEFGYNKAGQREHISYYDAGGNLVKELPIVYDEQGRLLESYVSFDMDGRISKTSFLYEDNARIQLFYSEDDKEVSSWNQDELNAVGYPVRSVRGDGDYTGNGSNVLGYTEYSYDERGNMVEIVHYDDSHSQVARITYEYNEQGNPTRHEVYASDEAQSYCELFEYREDGGLSKTQKFDLSGNLIEETIYD